MLCLYKKIGRKHKVNIRFIKMYIVDNVIEIIMYFNTLISHVQMIITNFYQT